MGCVFSFLFGGSVPFLVDMVCVLCNACNRNLRKEIKMSQKNVEHLEPNEVVFVEEEVKKKNALIPNTTFQVGEFVQFLLKSKLGVPDDIVKAFGSDGIDCRVLKLTGGWATGKIKLSLEFYPDDKSDPDSLDDLRKELNQ